MKIVVVLLRSLSKTSTVSGDNTDTFQHLFLRDHVGGSGSPPTVLYTRDDVYGHMLHAWKKYYTLEESIIGSYTPIHVGSDNTTLAPIHFCYTWHQHLKDMLQPRMGEMAVEDDVNGEDNTG